MRPIQPLVRLPHSHIDPNWLSTVERASRTPPREFYEWVADHILSVTGSLPGSRLLASDCPSLLARLSGPTGRLSSRLPVTRGDGRCRFPRLSPRSGFDFAAFVDHMPSDVFYFVNHATHSRAPSGKMISEILRSCLPFG